MKKSNDIIKENDINDLVKTLRKFEIELFDDNGEFKKLDKLLSEANKVYKSLNEQDKIEIAKCINSFITKYK